MKTLIIAAAAFSICAGAAFAQTEVTRTETTEIRTNADGSVTETRTIVTVVREYVTYLRRAYLAANVPETIITQVIDLDVEILEARARLDFEQVRVLTRRQVTLLTPAVAQRVVTYVGSNPYPTTLPIYARPIWGSGVTFNNNDVNINIDETEIRNYVQTNNININQVQQVTNNVDASSGEVKLSDEQITKIDAEVKAAPPEGRRNADGTPRAGETPAAGQTPRAGENADATPRAGQTPAADKNADATPRAGQTPATDKDADATPRAGQTPAADNNANATPRAGQTPAADKEADATPRAGQTPAADKNADATPRAGQTPGAGATPASSDSTPTADKAPGASGSTPGASNNATGARNANSNATDNPAARNADATPRTGQTPGAGATPASSDSTPTADKAPGASGSTPGASNNATGARNANPSATDNPAARNSNAERSNDDAKPAKTTPRSGSAEKTPTPAPSN